MTDAGSFYSSDDAWVTPNDPTAATDTTKYQSPYYLTMKVPGADKPAYSIYSTFIPKASGTSSRNVLTGYLVADADAGAEKGKRSADYGKLRLLTLPKDVTVPGPGQVQNNFNAWLAQANQAHALRHSREGGNPSAFTAEQLHWLEMIRDHIAANLGIEPDDFEYAPFNSEGGLGKVHQLFGAELPVVIETLNRELAA